MLMELRANWKVLLVFLVVVVLLVAGLVFAWPSMGTVFQQDELEGEENISLELEDMGGSVKVHLQWEPVEGADNYTVLVYPSQHMLLPERIEGIADESHEYDLAKEDGEVPEMYFAVLAVTDSEEQYVGMASSVERVTVYEEMFGVDMSSAEGMIVMLWDIFWALLIVLFLGYLAASTVTRDFEERKMDIVLSTPISRRRYLLEKFAFLALYTALMLVLSGAVLVASMEAIGELGEGMATPLFMSAVLAFPVALLFMAVSALAAVYLQNSKTAVGVAFFFVLLMFGINMVASMAEGLEHLSAYSALGYWDVEAIIMDRAYSVGDFLAMTAIALLLLAAAVLVFERRDIPG